MATDGATPESTIPTHEETEPVRNDTSQREFDLSQVVNFDVLKGVKIDLDYFEKQLGPASEKVARYMGDKLKGVDGQPLPDAAADLAMESVFAEKDARTQEILLKLAGNPTETAAAPEIQSIALDTMLLGIVVDFDAAYKSSEIKRIRYTGATFPDLAINRLNWGAEEIRKRFSDALAAISADNSFTKIVPEEYLDKQKSGDARAQDRVREALAQETTPDENPEPAPSTPPQGQTP